ncbi:PhoH-like protein [Actinomyces bovis]|uniref:PhoH-like protein n=1 Tax=Actinomyces bovis TaxID=1658 RepID=A0ABY1VK76_9ACTO|nr:PhoH family protein [Actinomyces bovis]SPT52496.1 PhoH-like protein [Actinomyces bovis]VEG54206.1 PhoH-like protein [Actinomyces israelii]
MTNPPRTAADATRQPEVVTRTLVLPPDLAPVAFLGARDEVLRAMERGFADVDIHVRGDSLAATGPSQRVDMVIQLATELVDVARAGTPLNADSVERAISLLDAATRPTEVFGEDVFTSRGKSIRSKSIGQKAYVDAIEASTITFGIGPAGTGKTYLAMAKAVAALERRQVSRIILTRPAVEAGENLGFLPGTLTDKIDPYLRPLYDALHDMLEPEALPKLMAAGTIEVAPLAYMRGRTLNDAFVILDEAQNTSPEQMKMFLTRLGFGSKMVVTGDVSQIDLPGGRPSGLLVVRRILDGVEGISFCQLSSEDVVRHRLVGRIIDAYAEYDAAQASLQAGPAGASGAPDSRGELAGRRSHRSSARIGNRPGRTPQEFRGRNRV